MQGILMTPDNHKAIRDKLKTQTRRLYNLKEINQEPAIWFVEWEETSDTWVFASDNGEGRSVKPRYRVGQTVYIKEAWKVGAYTYRKGASIVYKLDNSIKSVDWNDWLEKNTQYGGSNIGDGDKWRSPMFMPSWAARTFIKITDVRPERLKDITEEDAIAEGINPNIKEHDSSIDLRLKFAWLWDSINGKTYPFNGNYWVWRICFNLIEDKR